MICYGSKNNIAMILKTESFVLKANLSLRNHTQPPLTICTEILTLTKCDQAIIECRLTFLTNLQLYKRIETKALFNLKPERQNTPSTNEFLPEPDISVEISLCPDLLSHLKEHAITVDQTAAHIQNLSQEQPNHPLFSIENWVILSAKQPQESREIGYRTLWAYISPSVIAQALASSEELSEATDSLFDQLTRANLFAAAQKASSDMLEEMTDFFRDLTDGSLSSIENLAKDIAETETPRNQIFEAIISFFTDDDWQFIKLQSEPALRMVFQGENDKWACYAKAKEEQQQFVFYSFCPIAAPDDKRPAIAEFLTRANYGMTIGNFELDYTDGEIRYKTSIDVEGERLTSALIRSIVYTNVTMMDAYLPGIQVVIHQGISPIEAIRSIEQVDQTQDNQANPK